SVPLDGVHQLTMPAVLALHMDRDDRMQRRNKKGPGEDETEQDARDDQDQIEDRRNRLTVQQEAERRQQNRKQVDHRRTSSAEHRPVCGASLAAAQWALVRGCADSVNVLA